MPIRRIPPPQSATTPSSSDRSPHVPMSDAQDASAPEAEVLADSYTVGYARPPLHTRFRPGQSGNPKGRPRSAKGLKTIAREALTQKVTVRTAGGEKKISRMEAVVHKTAELAMKGNARALAELLKLYAAAVPDPPANDTGRPEEDLSATDLAMLEALRVGMLGEGESQ